MEKSVLCLSCAKVMFPAPPQFGGRIGGRKRPFRPEVAELLALAPNSAVVFNPCPGPHKKNGNSFDCYLAVTAYLTARRHGFKTTHWHNNGAIVMAKIGGEEERGLIRSSQRSHSPFEGV